MMDEVHGPSPPSRHATPSRTLVRLLPPLGQAALLIFLWGYWFFPDGWWHREFLLVLAAPLALAWLVSAKLASPSPSPWRDPWLALLAAAVALTLALPALASPPTPEQLGTQALDAALFLLFFAALRQLAASTRTRLLTLRGMVVVAVVSMALSLPLFYAQPHHFFPYARLRDMLVYHPDGLNPILTGLLAAAASSVALAFHLSSHGRARLPWLAAATFLAAVVFYTHSRGALLALGPGWLAALAATAAHHTPARPLSRCLRLAVAPAIALLAITLFYATYRPPLTPDQQAMLGHHASRAASQPALSSLADRGLAGRAEIHRAILARMSTTDRLLGRGAWADGTVDPPIISWHAHHPHSVWVGTFYYRGPLGTLLLLALVAWGLRRLWSASRSADPAAAALFAWAISGLAGLIFDGEDVLTLASIPRIEPLILLVPLALASPPQRHQQGEALSKRLPQPNPSPPLPTTTPAHPPTPTMATRKISRSRILLSSLSLLLLAFAGTACWSGCEIASPSRRPLMDYHREFLAGPAAHGIQIIPFTANDGTPSLIVTPDASSKLGARGTILRQQLAARGLALQAPGQIIGTLVLVHGRKGRKEDYLPIAERLCAAGFRCLIPDLPAHGDHPDDIARYGVGEAALPHLLLGEAAIAHQFDPAPASLIGMSMGGSVAIHAAAQPGAPWQALAVISSFDSFHTVVNHQAARHLGTPLGTGFGRAAGIVYRWRSGIAIEAIQPHLQAPSIQIPTLVSHGTADHIIPLSSGQNLFDSFPNNGENRWVEVPTADHDNVLITDFPIYAEITEWMLRHMR